MRSPFPGINFSRDILTFRLLSILLFLAMLASCRQDTEQAVVSADPGIPSTAEKPPADSAEVVDAIQKTAAKLKFNAQGNLVEADYRNTSVTNEQIVDLWKLTQLQSLQLSETKISDIAVPYLVKCQKLRHLDLRECAISNSGAEVIASLSNLESLRFSNKSGSTTVDDEAMSAVGKLTKLRVLSLDYLWISEKGLGQLKGLTELQELYLAQTLVGDEALAVLSQFPALKRLRLAKTSITSNGLQSLAALKQLVDLDISECSQVTDLGMESIGMLTSLQRLNLWRDPVSDAGVIHLAGLTNLKWLNLDNTQITDSSVSVLSGMTQLTFLHLGSTRVTDAGLPALEPLTALRDLKLTRTAVSDSGIRELQKKLPNTAIQLKYLENE